ncbi:MAG: hypothetical protein IKN75_10025 [Prevotella sp.]|nr:hypothetical protein [Prevotella sp.]
MRKKIFSALMLVAFFAATSSTLVSCKDYDEEISAVNTRIDNLDEDLSADIAALETQLNTAKTQLEATIAANKTAIESLQTKHDADVATLNGKIAENNQKIVDLTARVAALESAMTTAQAAIKNLEDNKADKSALNAAIAEANAVHAALTGDIKKLQEADEAIITAYKAADDALEAKITDAYKAADRELAAAYAAADENLKLQINANKAAIEALQKFQEEQLANNTTQQGAIDKNTGDIATNAGNISKNTQAISDLAAKEAEDIQKLNDALTAFKSTVAETYATKTALAEGMEEANNKINAVNDKVNLLNVLISKRLTSIVFAPNKYIDGVECIDFASIKYKSWGKADEEKKAEKAEFLRDYPTDAKYSGDNGVAKPDSFLIDNGTVTATYYVNPSGVTAENIASLEYIQNYATNYLTRADNVKDGIKLNVAGYEVKDGKLTVKLTKNVEQSKNQNQINNGNKDFTIVALKAEIAKAQLAEGEESAAVYSDWARLCETTSKVRIHQKGIAKADEANADKVPHFYAFSDIYTEFKKTTNQSSAVALHNKYPYDNLHILKNVQYNKTLDLNSLDDVCDTNGNIVDYVSYGLEFEHNLVEYNVLNENQTTDATNQAKYAKITKDENGHDILSSCAADGTITDGKNRDAIGKTPVIQVVLKDKVNNQVVDVRYYRIVWTLETPEAKTYTEQAFAADWGCGDVYGATIQEAEVNKFYAWAAEDGNGFDQVTFHAIYVFDGNLYGTAEAAKNSDATKVVGTVNDNWSNTQSTQAHNVKFAFNDSEKLTKSLYDGKAVDRMGYIAVKSRLYKNVAFIIPVKITISYPGPQIKAGATYNQTAWDFQGGSSAAYSLDNINKYVTSNPTLTNNPIYGTAQGFTDAQFINDLLNNYNINGAAPQKIKDLLVNVYKVADDAAGVTKVAVADSVKIIFDKDRLGILPGEAKWKVSADGKTLTYKDVIAAQIINETKVQLYEGATPGKGGNPTEGALLLVNYTADETTDVTTIKNAVPVKLVGTQCTLDVDMDKYIIRFEKPLTTINPNVTLEVKDQITTTNIGGTDYPGSVAAPAISNLFGLKETFGQYRTVLGEGATPGLDAWYIVGTPNYDLANAKTNYNKDGSIGDKCETKVSDIKDSNGNQYFLIDILNCADGQKHFQFQNQNGNALKQAIKIQFDVTISTKWLKNIKYTVTVTVQPNTNPGGAK